MINVPLLRKTLEYITAHPEEWDQAYWGTRVINDNACNTSHCLAGHAVVLNGDQVLWSGDDDTEFANFIASGQLIQVRAEHLLGLAPPEARALFSHNNSLYRLWKIANRLTNGEIEIPEDIYQS